MSTHATPSEQLLARVMAYLEGVQLDITPEVSSRALTLVQSALQQQDADPFAFLMDHLPRQFSLPEPELPALAPPVNRGSIGYRK